MPRGRRVRGLLLRLVLNRRTAIAVGSIVALPGALLLAGDYAWESGISDGLALVALATGIALVWSGLSGRRPDWIE
jgi:hypothetical protein